MSSFKKKNPAAHTRRAYLLFKCRFLLCARSVWSSFSECLVYYLNAGVTLLGADPHGDVQLSGQDMRPRHAVLTFSTLPPPSATATGAAAAAAAGLAASGLVSWGGALETTTKSRGQRAVCRGQAVGQIVRFFVCVRGSKSKGVASPGRWFFVGAESRRASRLIL